MTESRSLPRNMRVGCIQWQMRAFNSLADFLALVEKQVASLASYQCDFALFPEFFSAPLMHLKPELDTWQSMRELALLTPAIQQAMTDMARRHHINIVAGSMPVLQGKRLFNIAYVCHRNGRVERQAKLHPTPGEKKDWDMRGGDRLRVIDTDCGRIGVLICYDVEFPELPRLLAGQGIDVLFVPFWTDSKNGYLRVRLCAQARAIENEIYVALAGSTGCMPQVPALDVQFAQSAVFAPSDFGFPHDAIVTEATANVETVIVTDLDLDKLTQVRTAGSVRNAEDRRRDLYTIKWIGPAAGTGTGKGKRAKPPVTSKKAR